MTRPKDEAELIERLLAGDGPAADAAIDRFAQPLIRYFAARVPGCEAEDLAQEVFLRLVRHLRREERGAPAPLNRLVFAIARNLAIDVIRHEGRQPRVEPFASAPGPRGEEAPLPQEPAARGPDPREQALRAQQRALLESALLKLDPDTREIVVLRHVEGMTCPEIARIAGVPEGTVWSRLHRGLKELRRRLNAHRNGVERPSTEPKVEKPR